MEDLDLSGSRDVISHVTIRISTGHFLLKVHWNHVCISSRSQDTGPLALGITTELAAGQLSRFLHKGPVASKFAGSKPVEYRVWVQCWRLTESLKQS